MDTTAAGTYKQIFKSYYKNYRAISRESAKFEIACVCWLEVRDTLKNTWETLSNAFRRPIMGIVDAGNRFFVDERNWLYLEPDAIDNKDRRERLTRFVNEQKALGIMQAEKTKTSPAAIAQAVMESITPALKKINRKLPAVEKQKMIHDKRVNSRRKIGKANRGKRNVPTANIRQIFKNISAEPEWKTVKRTQQIEETARRCEVSVRTVERRLNPNTP